MAWSTLKEMFKLVSKMSIDAKLSQLQAVAKKKEEHIV